MVKERVGAELKVNTDLVMLFYTTITSTSNTLKNLVINSNYHSSYSTEELNTKKEQMNNIFITYVTPHIRENTRSEERRIGHSNPSLCILAIWWVSG